MRVKYAIKMRIEWTKSGDPGPNLGYDKKVLVYAVMERRFGIV